MIKIVDRVTIIDGRFIGCVLRFSVVYVNAPGAGLLVFYGLPRGIAIVVLCRSCCDDFRTLSMASRDCLRLTWILVAIAPISEQCSCHAWMMLRRAPKPGLRVGASVANRSGMKRSASKRNNSRESWRIKLMQISRGHRYNSCSTSPLIGISIVHTSSYAGLGAGDLQSFSHRPTSDGPRGARRNATPWPEAARYGEWL